ncbi:glycoside hydrolase [Polaribacter reichenbachii]|uniref:Glycoside hydrolase n=1 Tax=Polaribacter reichenbachii TaxID=996801 RepID=A0A1B8TVH5_9FLAO|nr:glycoside hydrolase family 28 protein [Polaribacter reichenbachii]APZ45403.1 glycoside hydrolase [Polaribacter reichenbachii]AUC19264.1 glycoside hydrolase [Polaribacter reichenbachii]OBY63580.1 glycoside hydrolase [Polaribacter reichenbachii]
MKTKSIIKLVVICLIFILGCSQSKEKEVTQTYENYNNIEFEMKTIQEPQIPNNTVNIKDFGAVDGGQVLNTKAFEKAIEVVLEKGGGKVIIPAGIWLTGPIILKSKLELHAEAGALIKFSTNKDLYPIIETNFEGLNTWRCLSPIYGKNLEDVAFTGPGVWDGSGDAWRQVKRSKITESHWKKLVTSGGFVNESNTSWYPSEQFKNASKNAELNVRKDLKTKEEFQQIKDFLRPVMVSIQNSKRVMFSGSVFQNSPAWCIHPLMVEDLTVKNITVRNPHYSQNGDGIDIESCKNVIVENSSFDVGDDAICIKSGKDKDGRDRNFPCENLIIRNNIVYHGHGGVTVGSEMSSGVKNMHVSNCTFIGTDVGLRFKSKRGRGGVVENIFISDVRMTNIPTNAISFNLYYGGLSVSEMLEKAKNNKTVAKVVPVSETTPQFKNIVIKDIVIDGAHQAVFLQGLPEMNLENVKISNLLVKADKGFSIIDADGITINNVNITVKEETVFNIFNSKNLDVSNIEFNSVAKNAVFINGKGSENIKLKSSKKTDFTKSTFIGETVGKNVVTFQKE